MIAPAGYSFSLARLASKARPWSPTGLKKGLSLNRATNKANESAGSGI